MSKEIKFLKKYYQNTLKHESQLDKIKSRLDFHSEKKSSFPIIPILSFTCASLAIIVAIPVTINILNTSSSIDKISISPIKNRLSKSIIQLDLNPTITLIIDEDGNVKSIYGDNNDGKLVLINENLINQKYEDTIAHILNLEQKLGYLINNDNYLITIYDEDFTSTNDLKNSINEYFNKVDLNINLNIETNTNYENLTSHLYKYSQKTDDFDSYYDELNNYYQDNNDEPTKLLEEFNQMYNHYANKIVYYKTILKTNALDNISSLITNLENKFNDYMKSYYNNFINENSPYQMKFNALLSAKEDYLITRNENENTSDEETRIDACIDSLQNYKEIIINGFLQDKLNAMDGFISNILNAIKDKTIQKDDEFNQTQEKIFKEMKKEFNNKYKKSKENIFKNISQRKANLIKKIAKK